MIHPLFTESKELYFRNLGRKTHIVYWLLVIFIAISISCLPFLYFDISVKTNGVIRPSSERTEIRSLLSGIIDTIFYTEGQSVAKSSIIVRLRDNNSLSKKILNDYEITQRQQFIRDLEILTTNPYLTSTNIVKSPVYKQQISRFIYQKADQEASLKKVKKELYTDSILSIDRVIAPKEMFDKMVENEKMQAAYHAFKNEQISVWQQDLAKYKLELSQLEAQQTQLQEEQKLYEIKAPISGTIQGINTRYAGGIVQSGEILCVISPETDLIAECYVPTHDVGLLKQDQEVKFQVDAFDYNYFGIVTGKIINIDNDFTLIDNRPVFKIRCSFDNIQLHSKNGFTVQLKKGLTLQARFIVTRRSAWQLLFDKIDDWLNPSSPAKK